MEPTEGFPSQVQAQGAVLHPSPLTSAPAVEGPLTAVLRSLLIKDIATGGSSLYLL